uniref:Uncharacterized protein n=1 Tax=Micrurus corallinus TaxID=54390 RepID=A0A2D4EPQ7_MICCO
MLLFFHLFSAQWRQLLNHAMFVTYSIDSKMSPVKAFLFFLILTHLSFTIGNTSKKCWKWHEIVKILCYHLENSKQNQSTVVPLQIIISIILITSGIRFCFFHISDAEFLLEQLTGQLQRNQKLCPFKLRWHTFSLQSHLGG